LLKSCQPIVFCHQESFVLRWKQRIAAFLFVWFLEKNGILYRPDSSKKIADNALVALMLMIAESKPEEKEMMIKVVVNLINLKIYY